MKANGIVKAARMAEAYKFGLMDHFTKDTGRMIRQMAEEDLFMLMEMFITENGKTTRLMALVFTITLTELDTKDSGLRTNSMVKVRKSGQTMLATRAITRKVRNTDTANSFGLMAQLILVLLLITI